MWTLLQPRQTFVASSLTPNWLPITPPRLTINQTKKNKQARNRGFSGVISSKMDERIYGQACKNYYCNTLNSRKSLIFPTYILSAISHFDKISITNPHNSMHSGVVSTGSSNQPGLQTTEVGGSSLLQQLQTNSSNTPLHFQLLLKKC